MQPKKNAYLKSIKEGNVRIVFDIEKLDVIISNSAEDFINTDDDRAFLNINFDGLKVEQFGKVQYELELKSPRKNAEKVLVLKDDIIYFDLNIEDVSKILNNEFSFSIVGENSEYISYFISKLEYKIKWLQHDSSRNNIITVSESKQTFYQPKIESDIDYSIAEIAKSAELLRKAIRKIDLRTNVTLVRLNTNDGYLDPVVRTIADRLGYNLEVLEPELIEELAKKGRRATHKISLKMN